MKKRLKSLKTKIKKIKKQEIIFASSAAVLVFGFTFFHNCATSTPTALTTPVTVATGAVTTNNLSASPLTLTLTPSNVARGGVLVPTATGGVSPYSYSVNGSVGTISGGVFTAGQTATTGVILVTDAVGTVASAAVTVNGAIAFTASPTTISTGGTVTLLPTGGQPPYTFSIITGGGKLNSTALTYIAPPYATNVALQVTDALNASATVTITTTNSPLVTLTPPSETIYTGESITMALSGGSGSYDYELTSGGGSITPTGGVYQAPNTPTTAVITAYDKTNGNYAKSTLTVVANNTLNNSTPITAYSSALLTAVIPQATNLFPSFILAGAGNSSAAGQSSMAFGYNVCGNTKWCFVCAGNISYGSTTSFEDCNSSTSGITLTNYIASFNNPYTGLLTITGNNGTVTFPFCIVPNATDQVVHLKNAGGSNAGAASQSSSYYSFDQAYSAKTSSGGSTLSSMWINNINNTNNNSTGSNATITLTVSGGKHDITLTDCSTYNQNSLGSNSNN